MPLICFRPGGAHRAWRTRWTGGPNRSGKAAVLYHDVFRIRPGRDLHDTGRGEFWSNPPETSRRCAHNLHRLSRADFNLHVGVALLPDASDDNQLASRYGGSRDQYFCMGISGQRDQTSSCNNCGSADKLCAHSKSPLQSGVCNLITKSQFQRTTEWKGLQRVCLATKVCDKIAQQDSVRTCRAMAASVRRAGRRSSGWTDAGRRR